MIASYRIGRGSDNDIIIDDPSISRRHAELEDRGGGRYCLRDLGSSNGTSVQRGGGWEVVDEAEIELDTPVRLGQRVVTAETMLALHAQLEDEFGAPPAHTTRPSRPTLLEATTRSPYAEAPPEIFTRVEKLPQWAIPAAAAGGGLLFIVIVAVVLLVGPLSGAGRSDFVAACTRNGSGETVCRCWAGEVYSRMSQEDFNELIDGMRKRDFRTALAPRMRARFDAMRIPIEAKCGRLG
jgi:hypothetical protein